MKTITELVTEYEFKSCGSPRYDVFRLIVLYYYENKTPPTHRTLAEGMVAIPDNGTNSIQTGNISTYLDDLQAEGLIEKIDHKVVVPNSTWVIQDEATTRSIISADTNNIKDIILGSQSDVRDRGGSEC